MAHIDAATTFSTLPELLGLLASQVRSRKQLARMRLTSRAFAAAAAPFLFSEIRIVRVNPVWTLRDLGNFEYVGYVKKLTIDGSDDYPSCNAIVQDDLLAKMPRLESFTWYHMPLASLTLRILYESCPRIKAIHVTFHEDMGQNVMGYGIVSTEPWQLEARKNFGRPDITLFSGLEELTLHNLCEELPWWRSQIAQVLRRNSQSIRQLSLSLSKGTCYNYSVLLDEDPFHYFFKELCAEYGGVGAEPTTVAIGPATASPLHIESLSLGTGMDVNDPTWLEALTDLRYLQEVHVHNSGIYTEFIPVRTVYESGTFTDFCGIAFCTFGPSRCPNLRRFTADLYRFDVYAFLAKASAEDPSWARRLAVSCRDTNGGFELATLLHTIDQDDLDPDKQYLSASVHLRMLDIDLERERMDLYDGKGGDLPADRVPSAKQVLEDLVAGDEGLLEGLTVHLKEEQEDNGEGGGGGFQHLDLLATNLAQLANLTQFAIQSYGGIFAESYFSKEQLADTARFLATAVPSLRCIKVCQLCWRIWRDEMDRLNGNRDGNVRLEVLEDREITDVELFRHTVWEPDAI